MIQVEIHKASDNSIGWSAQFPDSATAQAWINQQVANNSWGKPQRTLVTDSNGTLLDIDGTILDKVNAISSQQLTDNLGNTYIEYTFAAEYSVVQTDIGNAPLMASIRAQRDALLAASDWTQMPDSPLDSATKASWASYRQSLRALPDAANFDPTNFSWPVAP